MKTRDCSIIYRHYLPILIGLCVGITFSLVLTPAVDKVCQEIDIHQQSENIDQNNQHADVVKIEDSKNSVENEEDLSEYEPRINLAGKPHLAKKEPQTLVRPRYFSTELGMKDKSFVAVLSSIKQIPSLGLAINDTLANHVNRIAFFVEVAQDEKLDIKTLPIVGFKDSQQGLLTLHTLKYLADKLANSYSYFFLVKDSTYVNGKRLHDLMNHISITENVYMGSTTNDLTTSPSMCLLGNQVTLLNLDL